MILVQLLHIEFFFNVFVHKYIYLVINPVLVLIFKSTNVCHVFRLIRIERKLNDL